MRDGEPGFDQRQPDITVADGHVPEEPAVPVPVVVGDREVDAFAQNQPSRHRCRFPVAALAALGGIDPHQAHHPLSAEFEGVAVDHFCDEVRLTVATAGPLPFRR